MSIPKFSGDFKKAYEHIEHKDVKIAEDRAATLAKIVPESLLDVRGAKGFGALERFINNIANSIFAKLTELLSDVTRGAWVTDKSIMKKIEKNIDGLNTAIQKHPKQEKQNHAGLTEAVKIMKDYCKSLKKVAKNLINISEIEKKLDKLEEEVQRHGPDSKPVKMTPLPLGMNVLDKPEIKKEVPKHEPKEALKEEKVVDEPQEEEGSYTVIFESHQQVEGRKPYETEFKEKSKKLQKKESEPDIQPVKKKTLSDEGALDKPLEIITDRKKLEVEKQHVDQTEKIRSEMAEKIDGFIDKEITRRKEDLKKLSKNLPNENIERQLNEITKSVSELKSTYSIGWGWSTTKKEVAKIRESDGDSYKKAVESKIKEQQRRIDSLGIDKTIKEHDEFKKTSEALKQEAGNYPVEKKAVHAHTLNEAVKKGEDALQKLLSGNPTTLAAIPGKIAQETVKLKTTLTRLKRLAESADLLSQLDVLPSTSKEINKVKGAFISKAEKEIETRQEKMKKEYEVLDKAIKDSGFDISPPSFEKLLGELNEELENPKSNLTSSSDKKKLLVANDDIMKILEEYDNSIQTSLNDVNDIIKNSKKLEQIDSKIEEFKTQFPPQILYYKELEKLKNNEEKTRPQAYESIKKFQKHFENIIAKFDEILSQERRTLDIQLLITEKTPELKEEKKLIQNEFIKLLKNYIETNKKTLKDLREQLDADIFDESFKKEVYASIDKVEKSIAPYENETVTFSKGILDKKETKPLKNFTAFEWNTHLTNLDKTIKAGRKSISEFSNAMNFLNAVQFNFIEKSTELDNKIDEYQKKGLSALSDNLKIASKQHGEIVQRALAHKGSVRATEHIRNLSREIEESTQALSNALAAAKKKEKNIS